jgi:hypothetical protein
MTAFGSIGLLPAAGAFSARAQDFSQALEQPTLNQAPVDTTLSNFGLLMAGTGALVSSIGSFYAAKTAQYKFESDALSLDFQQTISNINARAAEFDAQQALEAGKQRKALATLRFGQLKAESRVSAAARGVQAGVGSAAEVQASIEFAKDVDAFTIDSNAFRAARAARRRALDFRNQAGAAGVGAANARSSRRSLNPALAAFTTALGGVGRVGSDFARNRRLDRLFGGS